MSRKIYGIDTSLSYWVDDRYPVHPIRELVTLESFDNADCLIFIFSGTEHPKFKEALALNRRYRLIDPHNTFESPSQKQLRQGDWKVLRELEKLLPTEHPLRVERDALRQAVDNEL
jgi:hypothetical protein